MWHDPVAPQFAKALLNPAAAKPAGVVGPNGKASEKRFNVYRNNVAFGLVEALGKNYPAVKAQCGAARFNDAAQLYLNDNPPRTRMMFQFGYGFAEWLDGFAPAKVQMPWLADLAKLERMWLDAYHAGDETPIDPAVLAAIAPDEIGRIRFIKHRSAGMVSSEYAIFAMLENGRAGLAFANPIEPQDVLVTRPRLDVEVRLMPAGGAAFIAQLFAGADLAMAIDAGLNASTNFDLSVCLGCLLQSGAASAILSPNQTG